MGVIFALKPNLTEMIEAPEACLLCEQLNATVCGKQITDVFTQYSPHKFAWFNGDPQEYAGLLTGKTIGKAHPRGGIIEITIGNRYLLLTDGVNLQYYAPGKKLPAKHQLLIAFEDESCLVASVRMYGGLFCIPQTGYDGPFSLYYNAGKEKPQVMTDAFNKEHFLNLINADTEQKKSAKAFLATEQRIPGLGNGVLQDILYHSRIHPKKKISALSSHEREKLYAQVKETLQDIYRQKGRSTETDLFGEKGRYVPCLSKDTAGHACPRCGETIVKENYLGGSIYYCRGCQKLEI